MPNNPTLYKPEDIQPEKEEINFLGKVGVNIENISTQIKLPYLITKRTDRKPLLGMKWLKELPITITRILLDKETNQSVTTIHAKIKKLFETNRTIKKTEVKIQIKQGCYSIQKKARPVPYHLQDDVKIRLNDKIRTPGKIRNNRRRLCRIPRCNYGKKKTKRSKSHLMPAKLNKRCMKKRPHIPNMDLLLNRISTELSKYNLDPL